MHPVPVLVVDDEPDICQLLGITLERMGYKTETAGSLQEATALLEQQRFSLCLTDMRLPDGDGLELISHISGRHPELPVAMITAHGNMDTAIDALKRGAFDFLTKPIDLEQLKSIVISAAKLEPSSADADADILKTRLAGKSASINQLRNTIIKVARSQAPVFIHGESGVGKEVCARCIHELGARSEEAFVAVNCGAIPAELVESEFFGHLKGSFTGAEKDKQGLFAAANRGSLLLDEVADLPLPMQVKLLRAIQEKSIRPVGGSSEIATDIRLLSATHKNLQALVAAGLFRDDLYYRINVIELSVPPLRDRREDIPELAESILGKLTQAGGRELHLSDAALDRLVEYKYPGNIRELENTLERSIALSDGEILQADDLIFQNANPAALANTPATARAETPAAATDANAPGKRQGSLDGYLETIERREILAALEQCRWNKTETAKSLGISFRSLRYRLKKLNLDE